MENYLVENLNELKSTGRINTADKTVINKQINSNKPIEDVPLWLEIAKVEKEPIVVAALKIIALGVLLLTTLLSFPSYWINLFIKYTVNEIPKLYNSGSAIIFAKFKSMLKTIIIKIENIKAMNKERAETRT